MKRRPHTAIKNARGEAALFRTRAVVGFVAILAGLGVLVGRFVWLQVLHHDEFSTRSEQNRVHVVHLPPARGLIYDRNGVLLADNVPAFRLEVVPERVKDMDAMLARLGALVPLGDDDLKRFRQQLQQHRAFQSVPLKLKLTEDEIGRFAVNQWRFPGVSVVPYLTRRYPQGESFAHVVGYVARIDDDDLDKLDPDRYVGTTHIGKTGIERQYENVLHGEPGYQLVEVNADQRVQRVLETVPPKPGRNLYLSLDARLQHAAEQAFAGRAGAAVAIDPRNGEVLAMVSVPSFDPNLFVNGIAQGDYAALLEAPDKPLLDRALRGRYPPGSTVKPFLGLAGLEYGLRRPEDTVLSTGEFFIPGQSRGYRDDVRGGQGRVDLVQAIAQSVNTYFYSLALDMGIDRMAAFMGKFGFGRPTGVDLPGEGSGVLPSSEWKRATFGKPWYLGETVIAGIGQGYWVITPLQLAHAVAMLANRGIDRAPHLLRATQDGLGAPLVSAASIARSAPSVIRNPADWAPVEQGMLEVVNGAKGTARGIAAGFPYLIAGKTGTAERYSRTTDAYEPRGNDAELAARHRALFIAFTPADAPRIAVAVVLEAGAWGGKDAAPIARSIMDAWAAEQAAPAVAAVGDGR